LKGFAKIADFFFQGSETCTSINVEKRFQNAQQYADSIRKNQKNQSDETIPILIFDEIGLAELSPDNPLKAIH
jgi:hypothetical protein